MIAFDTETELFAVGLLVPRLVCLTTSEGDLYRYDDSRLPGVVERLCTGMVGCNTPYDTAQIVQAFPAYASRVWEAYAADRVTDVATRQKLIDIAKGDYGRIRGSKPAGLTGGPYSLQGLYYRHTGIILGKGAVRTSYGALRDIPVVQWPEEAVAYAIKDAQATAEVFEIQEEHRQYLADQYRQTRAKWWLFLMSAWGMVTDPVAAERFAANVDARYEDLRALCLREGLVRADGSRDTKVAKARMTAACAASSIPVPSTKKGGICLDHEACKDSGDSVLEAYAELSTLVKIRSTDVPTLRRPIVQTRFEELQETGRTGSRDPNIQNLPRAAGMRECLVARPGMVFVDCDYDIIEMRTFAQICLWVVGSSVLAEKLNAGYDPHLFMGAALLGRSYDWAVEHRKDPEVKNARQRAKPINFGVPGGMGPAGLRRYAKRNYGVVFTLEEAATYRDLYLDTWPEAREYFTRIRRDLPWSVTRDGDEVTTVEHFKSARYRGRIPYTVASNTFFQGLAADLAKDAGFRIARECYDASRRSVLLGCRPVNFIHDQFLVEVPESRGAECAARVGELMREASRDWIPDVPATCTPALCYRFSKSTEAVYVNGVLIPYIPAGY